MVELKIAVVGLGIMGELFCRIYEQIPHIKVLALCDLNKDHLQRAEAIFDSDVRTYTNYEELFAKEDGLDAVHIATPDHLHYQPTIAALNAGLHVLVEKPLAVSVSEATAIVELAEKVKKQVMVNYTHRWATPYSAAYHAIQEGQLGEPVMCYARKNDTFWVATEMMSWTASTSSASYLSTHDLDLVLWMMNTHVKSVYAKGTKKFLCQRGIDTEDAIQALIGFSNGAFGTFESSWILPNSMPNLTDSYIHLLGSKGTIRIDRAHEGLEIADNQSYLMPRLSLAQKTADGRLVGGIVSCLEYFGKTLLDGGELQPHAQHGLEIVKVSEAIHRSIQENRVVEI